MPKFKSVYSGGKPVLFKGKEIGEVFPESTSGHGGICLPKTACYWGHLAYYADIGCEGHDSEKQAREECIQDHKEYIRELKRKVKELKKTLKELGMKF